MPTFCRHNRLLQNCSICSREQDVEMRPVITPQGRPEPRSRTERPASPSRARAVNSARSSGRMTVRRLTREADDGYVSALVPGIHAVADAERLAEELAFAATRLQVLATDPPELYAEVLAGAEPIEERTWLAFQIAALGPLDGQAPFAAIERLQTTWASGESPAATDGDLGPLGLSAPARVARVGAAYRAWAARLGSQQTAIAGDASWSPERRFDRAFERLGTAASMERGVRYELLVTLGRLGVYELRGERLHVGGGDRVTIAAKRILGIGDPLLLQRRAEELADMSELPFEALDLGFFNWERRARYGAGVDPAIAVDETALSGARAALGLER